MGPMKLYFDVRDIFRAPRLALSGKKIWIFVVSGLIGYVAYWILTYLALGLAGLSFGNAWQTHGLYPCLFGTASPWYAWVVWALACLVFFFALNLGCAAVARVTYKQLKGDEFYSSGDAWKFLKKHWHPVIFTSISLALIIVFFVFMAAIFALFGKIPYVGEFLFAIPYLLYFFGSVFTVYTAVVFLVSFVYTPAIVSTYEEDTMGAVFQSYTITWSQPWRLLLYNGLLVSIGYIAVYVYGYFWSWGYRLINIVFGHEWLMGTKLANIVGWATRVVFPARVFNWDTANNWLCNLIGITKSNCYGMINTPPETLSGTETVAGFFLAIFLFIILFTVLAYGLSILSVGETIMFVIFKKRSDDENLLERKDEEELEEEEEEEKEEEKDEETDEATTEESEPAESENDSEDTTGKDQSSED